MDSAARNFIALVLSAGTLAAYAICGSIAYLMLPLLDGHSAASHVPAFCLAPLAGLMVLLMASAGRAVHSTVRQALASRRLSRHVDSGRLPQIARLRTAVRLAGLDGRVTLVDSGEPFSFVYGAIVPRVAISRGLVESLSVAELRATLEHEGYHVRNLDPLRALIGMVLSEALFMLPLLAVLRGRYETARELAADRRAAAVCGPRPIAGALLKVLEGRGWADPTVSASLGGSRLMALRLSQLETGRAPRLASTDPAGVAWSALGVGAFLALFAAALVGLSGPAALVHLAATELRPATMIDGAALCVGPALLVAGLIFRALGRAAARPLTPPGVQLSVARR